jgi:type III restriction enzyme
MDENALDNPILNSPYDPPAAHFELGPDGPTGVVAPGRRRSESFIPVPPSRKGKHAQQQLDLDAAGERIEQNTLINDIRHAVDRWRAGNYNGVTPMTRKLLQYWSAPERDEPVFFCQREAAETAIYLAEAAGRHGNPDFRTRIDPENVLHNDGLPRVALKMATGTGKTVVMAMLIAWQTINKVVNPNDSRFAKKFLLVTPGITIRDRLRVLEPADSHNYYRERDIVPPDLWESLLQAQIVIINYHGFLKRDAKEIQGVAKTTRQILTAGRDDDPFEETDDQMVARVLRDLSGRGGNKSKTKAGEIIVITTRRTTATRTSRSTLRKTPLISMPLTSAKRKLRTRTPGCGSVACRPSPRRSASRRSTTSPPLPSTSRARATTRASSSRGP